MEHTGSQRVIGRLEATTEDHAARLDRIEQKIDHLVKTIDQTSGGWKALVAAGAIAAAITAMLGNIFPWLAFHK